MEHHGEQSLNRVAFSATIHCLTGCAIGEVLGMVIGTALGWGNGETIVLSIALAFLFGYSLTMLPLLRGGHDPRSGDSSRARGGHDLDHDHGDRRQRDHPRDPGRDGGRRSATLLFWGSLAVSLLVAGAAAYPANR